MLDLILGLIIAMAIIASLVYIYKAKKRGQKCIGCSCSSCNGTCHK